MKEERRTGGGIGGEEEEEEDLKEDKEATDWVPFSLTCLLYSTTKQV